MNILAIIPARGGSKGIPRKNIQMVNGKPLIEYTIEAALKSKYINKTVVSTEDKEIAQISQNLGSEVIERPPSFAEDESPVLDAALHCIQRLKENSYHSELVVLLQPTSPLRNYEDIDACIQKFLENDCDSVISVSEFLHSPYLSMKIENGLLTPNFGSEYLKLRRQDLPKLYIPNGAIYVSEIKNLKQLRSFYGEKIKPYIMPLERSIDIDTPLDLKMAELILGENNEN